MSPIKRDSLGDIPPQPNGPRWCTGRTVINIKSLFLCTFRWVLNLSFNSSLVPKNICTYVSMMQGSYMYGFWTLVIVNFIGLIAVVCEYCMYVSPHSTDTN